MLRTLGATIAAICTIGLIGAPTATADICANHGTGHGQIYKTACGSGNGGPGAMMGYKDADGNWHHVRRSEFDAKLHENYKKHRDNN